MCEGYSSCSLCVCVLISHWDSYSYEINQLELFRVIRGEPEWAPNARVTYSEFLCAYMYVYMYVCMYVCM